MIKWFLNLFKRKKKKCAFCDNYIDPDNCGVMKTKNASFRLCDECTKLVQIMSEKFDEMIAGMSSKDESV